VTDFLRHLQREADLVVATLRGADLGAPVPSCPGWALRDLVLHTGTIHRWALGRAVGAEREPQRELTDADLADWFAEGAQRLHAGLAAADPDTPCRGFEEPATVAFWIRRQAHETAVHRVDAQLATGTSDPVPAGLALDGVREVFEVFAPRQVALGRSAAAPYGLVLVSPDGTVTVPGPDPVTVRGSASDLLLALWRRPSDVEASDPTAWRAVLDSGLTP
jgi:uncharacterized protein (TIGR03083 family)